MFVLVDLHFDDVTWNSLDAVGSRDSIGEFPGLYPSAGSGYRS